MTEEVDRRLSMSLDDIINEKRSATRGARSKRQRETNSSNKNENARDEKQPQKRRGGRGRGRGRRGGAKRMRLSENTLSEDDEEKWPHDKFYELENDDDEEQGPPQETKRVVKTSNTKKPKLQSVAVVGNRTVSAADKNDDEDEYSLTEESEEDVKYTVDSDTKKPTVPSTAARTTKGKGQSQQQQPAGNSGVGITKLSVSNVASSVTEQDIKVMFGDIGNVLRVEISSGSAKVLMETRQGALEAIKAYNGVTLQGKKLNVTLADTTSQTAPASSSSGDFTIVRSGTERKVVASDNNNNTSSSERRPHRGRGRYRGRNRTYTRE